MSEEPGPGNALAGLLRRRLALGTVTVADYMRLALGHPTHGYYRTRDPFGAQGDFVTAPEISQMFGELVGLWCAHVWGLMGQPAPIRLVELGPGRGTMMADALRACAKVASSFVAAVDIHLVESSPTLRKAQRKALAGYEVTWHESPNSVPAGPLLLVANEFLDALPVHQLVRTGAGWCERLVALDPAGGFRFDIAPKPSPLASLLDPKVAGAEEGSIAELSPAARNFAAGLAQRISMHGGAALLIDYGYGEPAAGETLQAVRLHRSHPVLSDPGEADLTAHVDFSAIAEAVANGGARAHGPIEQGLFLKRLGIVERAEMLSTEPAKAHTVQLALDRLTAPTAMGSLFKVMALGPVSLDPMPGFVP